MTVTWPIQTSVIVTHPTVSCVTRTIEHESTKKATLKRDAGNAPATVSAPRLAATCKSTASTVFVPNSQARRTRGASVCSTSQSGMTTLSSTWLVPSTPSQVVMSRNPRLRSASGVSVPAPSELPLAVVAEVVGEAAHEGRVHQEHDRSDERCGPDRVEVIQGKGDPAKEGAKGAADVACRPHESQ